MAVRVAMRRRSVCEVVIRRSSRVVIRSHQLYRRERSKFNAKVMNVFRVFHFHPPGMLNMVFRAIVKYSCGCLSVGNVKNEISTLDQTISA